MALPPLHGHAEVRAQLARASAAGTLPQSILLHGPPGVGKERLGLWLAARLVCEQPAALDPCERCAPCRLVSRLEHPDVHWFFPLSRPEGASSPERLQEKLEEARSGELQRRREDPFQQPAFEKPPAHFLAAVRTIQRLAALRPSLGARSVFLIGDAELMVPQEASQEAANAFLKLLEEPPAYATFILTSSQPGALLPTIRSRVLGIRAGALAEAEIATFLSATGLAGAERAPQLAHRAAGSVRRAIENAARAQAGGEGHEPGRELLLAALASSDVPRLSAAHAQRAAGARGDLSSQLDSLARCLRDLLALATGADAPLHTPEVEPVLRRVLEQRRPEPHGILEAIRHVFDARELAYGNLNPQLIVATLLQQISNALTPTPGGPR